MSLFEHDDREGRKSFEQLTRAKQEIGTARRAEASVAAREGPVGQRTPRRKSAGNRWEQRAVQVIGDYDSIILAAERQCSSVSRSTRRTPQDGPANVDSDGIVIDRASGKSTVAQEANMPAIANRKREEQRRFA